MIVQKFEEFFGTKGCRIKRSLSGSYPRYVQAIPLNINKEGVHYELYQASKHDNMYLQFHIERSHYWEHRIYVDNCIKAFAETLNRRDFSFETRYSSQYWGVRRPIMTNDDLCEDGEKLWNIVSRISYSKTSEEVNTAESDVNIESLSGRDLLDMPLQIPTFQRGYCWRKKDILGFLESISRWQEENPHRNYHIGVLVLRAREDKGNTIWDVIDGQQRIMTLAMVKYLFDRSAPKQPQILNARLQQPNTTLEAKNRLLHARDVILGWKGKVDFDHLECGLVELSHGTPLDLAYSFFNHINASGVRLSDYDLLKSHHLRFVSGDVMSEKMASIWDSDDQQSIVLHKMLFRLRQWTAGGRFEYAADTVPWHDLFRHFEDDRATIPNIAGGKRNEQFDSIIKGGIPFFMYYESYKVLHKEFSAYSSIIQLRKRLSGLNNSIICDGIEALAFLFYMKFGGLYLDEVVYCLAFHLSQLRNERQIRRAWLSDRPIFRTTACLIAHACEANDVVSQLLNEKEYYVPTNDGKEAMRYWNALVAFLTEDFKNKLVFLPESNAKRSKSPFNRGERIKVSVCNMN